jgi:hypothetical protein
MTEDSAKGTPTVTIVSQKEKQVLDLNREEKKTPKINIIRRNMSGKQKEECPSSKNLVKSTEDNQVKIVKNKLINSAFQDVLILHPNQVPVQKPHFETQKDGNSELDDICDAIKTRKIKNEKELRVLSKGLYQRYRGGLLRILNMYAPVRTWKSEVYCFYGRSNRGNIDEVYRKEHEFHPELTFDEFNKAALIDNISLSGNSANPLLKGYIGQDAVLFNNFNPDKVSIRWWGKICDRCPYSVNVGCGEANWTPKRIYFTTNIHPKYWWDDWSFDVKRRFIKEDTNMLNIYGVIVKETGTDENEVINSSKAIKVITKYFDDLKIIHREEKTFEGLIDKGNLRIDIYIPRFPDIDFPICIEYDGNYPGSHFSYIDETGKQNHISTVKRDKIKDKFALDNRMHMVRIPYTCFSNNSIEQLVENLELAFEFLKSKKEPFLYLADVEPYRERDDYLGDYS